MATVSTAYPAQLGTRKSQRTGGAGTGLWAYITGTTIQNNRGTIITGGTVASTSFTSKKPRDLVINGRNVGSQNFVSTEAGHIKAENNRSFGVMTAGSYIIPKVTTSLGGVATTVLATNGNKIRRGLHFNVQDNATLDHGATANGWDYVSGQHRSLPDASTVLFPGKNGSTTTAGTVDKATLETQSAPGRLTFMRGSKTANSTDYPARTF
jgi:hypothetical protein